MPGARPAALVVLLVAAAHPTRADELPRADPRRLEARILALGRFGANPEGGVSRVAFSPADVAGREYVVSLRGDAAGPPSVDPMWPP